MQADYYDELNNEKPITVEVVTMVADDSEIDLGW